MKRTLSIVASAAMLLGGAALVGAPSADAAAQPAYHLAVVHRHIEHGSAPRFRFSTQHLGHYAKLYLSRQEGTSQRWHLVRKLHHRRGSFTAPKLSGIGRYSYRLVGYRHDGAYDGHGGTHHVFVYGNISVARLCEASEYTYFDGCGDEGTIQVGGQVFTPQADTENGNTSPDGYADVTAQHSSCRSVSLSYAVPNDQTDSRRFGISMTQASADEQDSAGNHGSIVSVRFSIRSSAWDLIGWTNDANYVYFRGHANCWTADGDS